MKSYDFINKKYFCPLFSICIADVIPGITKFISRKNKERELIWLGENAFNIIGWSMEVIPKTLIEITDEKNREQIIRTLNDFISSDEIKYEIDYNVITREGKKKKIKEIGVKTENDDQTIIQGILIDMSLQEDISKKIKDDILFEAKKDILSMYRNDLNNTISGIYNILAIFRERMENQGEAFEENPSWRDIRKLDLKLKELHSNTDFIFSINESLEEKKDVNMIELLKHTSNIATKLFNLKINMHYQFSGDNVNFYCDISPEKFMEVFILFFREISRRRYKESSISISLAHNEYNKILILFVKIYGIKPMLDLKEKEKLISYISKPSETIFIDFIKENNGNIYSSVNMDKNIQEIKINFPIHIDPVSLKYDSIPKGKGQTILIIDDDEIVKNTTAIMIKKLGYNVLEASDGFEAEKVFFEHMESINIILIDLIMPERDGFQTAVLLQSMKKDIKYIFMSGFKYDRRFNEQKVHILEKPFSISKLANVLERVLEENIED